MSLSSETVASVVLGGLISAAVGYYFSRRTSRELKSEAASLRRLTITLTQILEGQGVIEVAERDPDTGEPNRWPVESRRSGSYAVEAPTPRWKRIWRWVFRR